MATVSEQLHHLENLASISLKQGKIKRVYLLLTSSVLMQVSVVHITKLSKLKKFQYRDCHVYIVYSVLCAPHGLSVPSVFHSPHISSANPAFLPQLFTDYLIFTPLKRPSNLSFFNFTPFHHRISVSPHSFPAGLFFQDKVTLVLFKANHPPTPSHNLQKVSLLFLCKINYSSLCLISVHFSPDFKDNVLTLFLLCSAFQTWCSTVDLLLKRVVLNPWLSLITTPYYILGSRFLTSQLCQNCSFKSQQLPILTAFSQSSFS